MDKKENPSPEVENSVWTIVLFLFIISKLFENEYSFSRFKEDVKFKSRYIPTENSVTFFENIRPEIEEATVKLRKGSILYRARIAEADLKRKIVETLVKTISKNYNPDAISEIDDSIMESTYEALFGVNDLNLMDTSAFREVWRRELFQGYSKKESGMAPAQKTPRGRLNPDQIPFLYTADSKFTAVYEVKPTIGQTISIAKLKTNRGLKILDLTKHFERFPVDLSSFNLPQSESTQKSLLEIVADEFRKPNNGDPLHYIPTQFFSEYVREIGKLDGIRFWSSLKKGGKNTVLFHPDGCDVVSSSLVMVENINIKFADF